MSPRNEVPGAHSRRRAWLIAGAVAFVAVATWTVIAWQRRDTAKPAGPPQASKSTGMPGMAGMEGMTASANGSVMLTPNQVREFGITFGVAEVRQLAAEVRTTGVVTIDETRMTQVAARMGGFVERLHVNATGQRVNRGQPLMDVYSPELVAAQQELLLARQLQRDIGGSAVPGVPDNTTDFVGASRRRLQLLDISSAQIDDVLRTGRVRRTLTLFAPASGVVVEKKVVQGQSITAGEMLYSIADLTGVWIDVSLREADASRVRIGAGADIQVSGLPGTTLKGSIKYVYPTIDSASRAIRARVVVSNASGALKPGMYATVRLSTPTHSALTVPSSAVLRTGERDVVFMDMGKGSLMPMEVRTGGTAGAYTEIVSGLEAGARVVTSAQFLLDSESNLGEVMKSMLSQPRR